MRRDVFDGEPYVQYLEMKRTKSRYVWLGDGVAPGFGSSGHLTWIVTLFAKLGSKPSAVTLLSRITAMLYVAPVADCEMWPSLLAYSCVVGEPVRSTVGTVPLDTGS